MKIFKFCLVLTIFSFILASPVKAFDQVAGNSASLQTSTAAIGSDKRVSKLKSYLENQNSVLAADAQSFVEIADKYRLDWRLLPAIAGMESTFAKHLPANSYNPFGWGIYGNQVLRFASYQEAIETVANGLATKYPNPNQVEAIARSYCPPNCVNWAAGVRFFMNQIENTPESTNLLDFTL